MFDFFLKFLTSYILSFSISTCSYPVRYRGDIVIFVLESPGHDTASLLCVQCKDSFVSAWDLMEHVQAAHMLNIYELGTSKMKSDDRLSPPLQSTPPESPNNKEVCHSLTLFIQVCNR